MHQAHIAYPAIRGLGSFGASGIEDASVWSTRSSSAKYASGRAKDEAAGRGNMAAMGAFQGALAKSSEAANLVSANRADFTIETEKKVADLLAEARNLFGSGVGVARTAPPQYTPSVRFPTWSISARALPPGSPGAQSPGTPPPGKTPPKGDEGGVDEGSTKAPEWYKQPVVLAGVGIAGAVVLLTLVMATRR